MDYPFTEIIFAGVFGAVLIVCFCIQGWLRMCRRERSERLRNYSTSAGIDATPLVAQVQNGRQRPVRESNCRRSAAQRQKMLLTLARRSVGCLRYFKDRNTRSELRYN
jgi:hypothetical protein